MAAALSAHGASRLRDDSLSSALARLAGSRIPRHAGSVLASAFLLASVGYGITLAGAAPDFGRELARLANLSIQEIRIEGQNEVPTREIIEAIREATPAGLMTVNADSVRESVEAIGWVSSATVLKLYPDTLKVSVREHTPFALWQRGDEVYVVAEDGTVLADYIEAEHAGLPLFVGAGANVRAGDLLAMIGPYDDIAGELYAAVFVGNRRWNLLLTNGTEIRLPELNPELALARVQQIAEAAPVIDPRVAVVDVRLSDRIVLRRADGEPVGQPEDEEAGT